MKKKLSGKTKITVIVLAVLMLCIAAIVAVSLFVREDKLEELQNEAISELERNEGQYDERSIVLRSTSKARAEELAALFGAELRITENGRYARLTLPEGVTVKDVWSLDENRVYLEEMSADYQVRIADVEEDTSRLPLRPDYTVSDADYALQTYLDYINMQNLWYNYTGTGVTVAVIDTGIDTDHPEFAGRISEYSYNATEDKIVKDWGYDWSLIEDEQGHGTAVTGVIAGTMNSGNITGIAPNVNILVIKAECAPNGSFYRTSDLVFGLYYAIERDVQVVNMSFGTYDPSNPFAEATQLAYDSDIICVAAAGNEGTSALSWPAADPNVIGVGALAENSWSLANYSNYGDNSDIVAPGTVYTSLKNGTYGTMNGTSFSSPVTAAAIALFMQNNRYMTFDEVTEVLFASSYDLGALGNDWDYGFGALDVYSFVCGQRGTVTYDMLTDELENEEGLFIRGIALQELPEPERLYAVFDGWYYDDTFTEAVNYYADAFEGDLTLYAKWVNEDDGIPYTYVILDDGTIEIRSYKGHRRFITVPEKIEGRIVSSIGDFAFAGQSRLREVTLPSGLNKIGRYAFQNCSNLVTMHIPVGVKTIGEYAFASNVRLYTLSFDANSVLESIGAFAFSGCGSLERIELPVTLKNVDGSAFFGTTSLTAINVRNGNASFISIDGVLFDITASTLVAYPAAHGTTYTLPASTVNIADLAFPMARIKSIDLGQVQTIGGSAFIYSTLEALVIPDSVISMGGAAFASNSSLSSLTIGRGLNSVSDFCFASCASLNTVLIPNNIVVIDAYAFIGSGLRAVVFESGSKLTAIGESAFFYCNISAIDIPASVTEIGESAFAGNPITSVTFAENAQLHTIFARAFAECNRLPNIIFPETLQTIGDAAFAGCSLLKNIKFTESLDSIGNCAFMSTALTEITVPMGVTSLGYGVFACCDSLTSIEIAEGNTVYHDINGVVYTLDNSKIHMYPAGREEAVYTIEAAARSISPWAFAGTAKLGCAVLPEGMYRVDEYAFYLCGATTYVLPSTLTHIMAHAFDTSYNLNSLILPEALVQIAEYAFTNCSALPYIQIPDNVLQIGRYAFSYCWNLSSISFNATAKLPRISFGAFAYSGINYFTVPANVSTIAQGAFEGCKNLYSVTFAENSKLESISAYMFDGCSNLQSIVFMPGSALTSIQAHGLEGMDRLNYIDFGDAKLMNVDNFAFRFCESLSNITFPETLTNIGRYAFYGCKNLSELTVPANVEHIGSYAFLGTNSLNLYLSADSMPEYLDENWDHGIRGYYVGVTSVNTLGDYKYATLTSGNIAIIEYLGTAESVDLTTLNLGAPITAIGGRAFKDGSIKNIILPETLTEIQAEAFMYTALEKITIPASVTFIGREAFAHTDIATLTLPTNSSLKYIEQYAFEGTENLKLAILPASLERMGTGVFLKSGLEAVVFADGIKLEEIPQRAFAETKLIAVALPDSVTLVNHNAFNSVETLQSVSFGNNDGIRLMSNAFYHTGLTSLNIPANVTYIGEYCFVALKNLTAFTVDANNPNYTAIDGLLTTKSGRKLIAVPAGRAGTLNVPVCIEEIGFGAFEESSLSAINFDPNANILTFGYRAFFKAENITEMNIPASVVSIDYYAFAYCENLTTVTFAEGNKLKGIYEGAFCGCINLENIIIPDSVVEISDFAFYGCSKITKLPVSETSAVKGIYDYAFAYTGLSGEFTTPETLIDIGNYAFLGCKFTKVTIPDTNKKQLLIGIGAFEGCNKLTEITVPFIGASFEDEEISWFGYIFGAGFFEANETYVPASLKCVKITNGIKFIYPRSFKSVISIETIYIPASIDEIGEDAFFQCNGIKKIYIDNVKDWLELSHKWSPMGINTEMSLYIDGKPANELIIPEGITTIPDGAFSCCTNIVSVVFPKSVTDIGKTSFLQCNSIEKVYIPDLSWWIKLADNPIKIHGVPKDLYLDGELVTDVVIVSSIEPYALYNSKSIRKVVVQNNISSIGDSAFENCANLEEVILPDSILSIGYGAFKGCTSLVNIKLPNNVNTIHSDAFYDCTSLVSINIPDYVTVIKDNLFYNCTALESVTIGKSVSGINSNAFYNCSNLKDISFPAALNAIARHAFYNCTSITNINIESIESWLKISFQDDDSNPMDYLLYKQPKILYLNGEVITNLIIPEGVEYLNSHRFCNVTSISSVELPSTLKEIGGMSFIGCYNISVVKNNSTLNILPGKTTNGYVSYYATVVIDKDGNYISKNSSAEVELIDTADGFRFLKTNGAYSLIAYLGSEDTITLPDSINGEKYTLSNFSGGKNIIIPNGIQRIDKDAFKNNTGLESIVIPDSVTYIGQEVFYGCINLKSIVIPDSVQFVGSKTFYGCKKLSSVTIGKGLASLSSNMFFNCPSLTEIVIPSNIQIIGDEAFVECKNLENVVFCDGLTYIGSSAFKGCKLLKALNLPDTLQNIGNSAFEDCTGLVSLVIPDSVTEISYSAFCRCSNLEYVELSDNLVSIRNGAFLDCTKIDSIIIPGSVTQLERAFSSNTTLIFEGDETHFIMQDGIMYDYPITKIIYVSSILSSEIVIPEGVTEIPMATFGNHTEITKIVLPSSLTLISDSAFAGCTELEEINIPAGIKKINQYTFKDCKKLKTIDLPEGLITINDFAFSGSGLISVSIPDSVTKISRNAFENCISLVSVKWSKGTTSIYNHMFMGCLSLQNIEIPDTVSYIYENAFEDCTSLTNVTLPSSLKTISDNLFANCTGLKSISIPEGITTIGYGAFSNCLSLTEISIHPNITSIASTAFENCTGLKNVIIQEGAKVIGGFIGCTGLTSINIPNSVTTISSKAFYGCTGLVEVVIPDSVTEIGNGAFSNCSELTKITLSNSITNIPNDMFSYCVKLNNITLPNSITSIGDSSFMHCTALKSIIIPDGVISIGSYTFRECKNLRHISIPDSVTVFGSYTFQDCMRLTEVTIPSNLQYYPSWCFEGCKNIVTVYNRSNLQLTADYFSSDMKSIGVVYDKDGNKIFRSGIEDAEGIVTENDFLFVREGDTYRLLAYLGDNETITLPADINGHSYVMKSFNGPFNIIIPEGITSIDQDMFRNCDLIKNIVLPQSVTSISQKAFEGCAALENVIINGTLTEIGNYTFSGCTSLTSIIIPEGVTSIGIGAFEDCINLANIVIPSSVNYITLDAFKNTAIYNEDWRYGLFIVDGWLIQVAEDIEYITGLESFREIAGSAYQNCYRLKNMLWKNGLADTTNVETIIVPHLYGDLSQRLTLKNIVLNESVELTELRSFPDFFRYVSGVTIFVEHLEEDLRWDDNFPGWNYGNKVVYGDDWHWVNFYDETGKLIYSEPVRNAAVIKPPVYTPETEGEFEYILLGWDIDGDGIVDSVPATSVVDIEAHAVVVKVPASYTVNFMAKDRTTAIASFELPYGAEIFAPEVPVVLGHKFLAWTGYTEGMKVESDITFYSEWSHDGGSHQYIDVPMAPTCTEQGGMLHLCTVCGESYLTDIVSATGHTYSEWIVDVAPSCTTTGTKYRVCHCGEVENAVASAVGHGYDINIVTSSTCETAGTMLLTCRVCGDSKTTQAPIKNHSYEKEIISSDMMNWFLANYDNALYGYDGDKVFVYRCTDCARIMTVSESETNSSGVQGIGCKHIAGDWTVIKPASCQNGLEASTCILCGDNLDAKIIPAIGEHQYEIKVTAPTCTEAGFTAHTCKTCNNTFTDAEVPKLGHDITQIPAQAATCTEIGWNAYEKCSRCSYTTYVEIPALKHDLTQVPAKPATCTEIGWNAYEKCSRCTYTTYVEIPALKHDLTQIPEKAPTCTEIGWNAYEKCSRCSYTTYVEIPTLKHDLTQVPAKPATCTEIGWNAYEKCSRCSYTTYVELPALKHDLTQVPAKPATCTEIGWNAYEKCSRCTYTTYVEMPMIEHTYTSVVVNPQFGVQGYTLYTCSACGYSYKDNYTDALTYLPGDIDGTGTVDATDAETILKYITGHNVEVVEDALDVNGDGVVNIRDAATILLYLEGKKVALN